jgi:hypothetical protein
MGVIFGFNAIAAALLGLVALALAGAVTGFCSLLTAALIARSVVNQ